MVRRICAIARAQGGVLSLILTLRTTVTAQESVSRTQDLRDSSETDSRVQQEYEANRLGLFVGTDARAKPKSADRWTLAYEGRDMKPLEGTAFYEKIGRPDLVRDYHLKQLAKIVLGVTGGLTLAYGVVLGLYAAGGSDFFKIPGWYPVAFIVGGTGLLVWGLLIDPNPVNELEARGLVDAYNQRLKDRLGLSSEREHRSAVRVAVAPMVSSAGGGLSLQLSF